jgi:hypothetical protein
MSFSSDIKKELCSVKDMTQGEMRAMLYGIYYSGRASSAGRSPSAGRAPSAAKKPRSAVTLVQTENADLVAAARALTEAVFPKAGHETKRLVKNGSSLYTFSVSRGSEELEELFGDCSEVNSAVVSGNDAESGAFLRGVFVSCGSVTDPTKEYHLELVLPENSRSEALREFIAEHGMDVRTTVRNRRTVIYAKESELIEDFLTYIGAGMHSLEIMQVKIEKSVRNRVNRAVNCETANLDKTVNAANKSCEDIELILRERGADWLKPELRQTAMLRLENPESPLSELCELSGNEISRSGLNHRLKKLSALAEEIRRGEK